MIWKQDVTPNLNDQTLVVFLGVIGRGNPLSDWYGDCAAVERNAYGIAEPKGENAWDIFTNFNQFNHEDRNWPVGVYFPIWFSGYGGLGHTAIAYWNGTDLKIWTSPYTHKAYFDYYTDVDRLAQGYGVTYVGWSEDFAGTRVIEYVPDVAAHPYTVEAIDTKQAIAPNGAMEWNLDDTDWSQFNSNPVSRLAANEPVTVTAIAHHNLGGDYYMPDPSQPAGYNVVDLQDYTAPIPPQQPTPTPTPTNPTDSGALIQDVLPPVSDSIPSDTVTPGTVVSPTTVADVKPTAPTVDSEIAAVVTQAALPAMLAKADKAMVAGAITATSAWLAHYGITLSPVVHDTAASLLLAAVTYLVAHVSVYLVSNVKRG